MPLPTPLLRNKKNTHKNNFGHVLVLAGSTRMLGAGALCSLAAMRSGAGLVTWGVPKSLNAIAQKKCSNVVMTWPLPETKNQAISARALGELKKTRTQFSSIVLGPGLGQDASTQRFILGNFQSIALPTQIPTVIDADALNALVGNLKVLEKNVFPRILTPHVGEFARLTGESKNSIEKNREKLTQKYAKKLNSTILLKGHHTVVADPTGKLYINKTGNAGMATAGSGDVLSGVISAFLAQGLTPFDAAKWGSHLHGLAGDLAAKQKGALSLIASDLIDFLPKAMQTINTK